MKDFLNVMLICLQIKAVSTASTEGTTWTALLDYDDRLPDTQVISTSPTTVRSKVECGLICLRQSGCNGFFFNDVSNTCLPVSMNMSYRIDVIMNGVTSMGYRYYSNRATCPLPTMDSLVHVQSSSCFQVISDISMRKIWRDARDACDSEGGRLAVLDTKDKIDTVMDVMRDNTDFKEVGFYLGAHRPMDRWNTPWPNGKPDFIWLNDQPLDLNLTAPYWKDTDPNNYQDSQNVIMLYGDQGISRPWVDENADRIEGYICEFSLI